MSADPGPRAGQDWGQGAGWIRPVLLGLAAVVTMVAVAAGVAALMRPSGTPASSGGGEPMSVETPTASTTAATPTADNESSVGEPDAGSASAAVTPTIDPTGSARALGDVAAFEHFSVRVDSARVVVGQGVLVRATVCVRSLPPGSTGRGTRISWDPWRVTADGITTRARLADGSHPPASLFPQAGRYAVAACARGVIPFADAGDLPRQVSYRNSLGDEASWSVG